MGYEVGVGEVSRPPVGTRVLGDGGGSTAATAAAYGRFEYATPYDTIEQIVNQWGDAPTRANVLAKSFELASIPAFGAVSLSDLRRAAGVGTASHPRMN